MISININNEWMIKNNNNNNSKALNPKNQGRLLEQIILNGYPH